MPPVSPWLLLDSSLLHLHRAQLGAARRRVIARLLRRSAQRMLGQHLGASLPSPALEICSFTFRSSMDMKADHHHPASAPRSAPGAISSSRSSSPGSSLTAIRSAMNVFVSPDADGPSGARPAPLHRPDAVCSVWAVPGRLLWLSSAPSFLRRTERSSRRVPFRRYELTRSAAVMPWL